MSNGIYLVGRGRVKSGRVAAARAALAGVVKHVRETNPGITFYEHAIDAETGAWLGMENYADGAALKRHLLDPAVGAGLGQFMADIEFEGVVVVGNVSDEVREMMAAFNPTYLGTSLGFARPSKVVGAR
jgi:quinol monooxygenase YgiN